MINIRILCLARHQNPVEKNKCFFITLFDRTVQMNGSIILIYFFINEALKQFDSFLCYLVDYLNDNDIDYRFFVRADNNLQIRNKIKKLTILEGEELSGYRKFLLLYTKKKELRKTISDYSKEEKPSFVYFRDNPFYSKFFLSILKKNNPNLKNGFQLTFPFYKERGVLSRFIKKIYVQEMKKMHYVFPISQKRVIVKSCGMG